MNTPKPFLPFLIGGYVGLVMLVLAVQTLKKV